MGKVVCWWLVVLLRCSRSPSIAPCHSKEPTPSDVRVVLFFVFVGTGGTSTAFGWLEVEKKKRLRW